MSWVQELCNYGENYGKCIILNQNAELEPVKCDSNHYTICSVNNSLLTETKQGCLDGIQKTGTENGSTGNVSLLNTDLHDTIAY